MIISRLKLKNWKNFKEVDAPLSLRTFIVGPNASGKSNLLDAIRFLRDIAIQEGGGIQKAVGDRDGMSKIRCLAARTKPDIEIEVELMDPSAVKPAWKYSLGLTSVSGADYQKPLISHEKVWKNSELILSRPLSEDRKDKLRLTQTHLEQINANAHFREIAEYFRSVKYFHLIPQLIRQPDIFVPTKSLDDPFGRSFLDKIALFPARKRKSYLNKIIKALTIAVPQFNSLSDVKDKNGLPHLEAVYKHWRLKGARQNEKQFSDGTLRLIGFLWSVLESDALLLMEEPELSLHSGIIRRLPDMLWKLQTLKNKQTIISTHSFDLLSNKSIAPEEVLALSPSKEGTEVVPVSAMKDIKLLLESGFSIAEAVIPITEPKNTEQLLLIK